MQSLGAAEKADVPGSGTMKLEMETNSREGSGAKASTCQHICSWRMLLCILLQFSIVTLSLPKSTFNMAFVCSTSRRQEVLHGMNKSGDSAADGQLRGNSSLDHDISHASQVIAAAFLCFVFNLRNILNFVLYLTKLKSQQKVFKGNSGYFKLLK